jgi:dipeptidyl-peptidase 4
MSWILGQGPVCRRGWRWVAVLTAAWLMALGFAKGEGGWSRADYEHARGLRERTQGKVFRDRVQPHWFDEDRRFWYRNDLAGGAREYVLVETETGRRQPAFDHARLAGAWTQATGESVAATHLAIDSLRFEEEARVIRFRSGAHAWRCDLANYELRRDDGPTASEDSLPVLDGPRATTRTGEETEVTFVNRTSMPVRLYWLDFEGERRAYGGIEPGGERRQHTFGGHVWLAVGEGDQVLAVFEAADEASVAVIGGEGTRARRRSPERRSRDGLTSPDGLWRAYFADHNLQVRDLESGEEFSLSTDGTAEDAYDGRVYWSPDSKRVVAVRTRKGGDRKVYYVESSPKDQLQPKLHSYHYLKPGDEILRPRPVLFDLEERRMIRLDDARFAEPWSITDLRWRPDGREFTFLYNERGHQVLRVLAVDAETGAVRVVVDERSATFIDYAGKQYLRHLEQTGELIWMSERDGWNHLYLYDVASGAVKCQLTRGSWVVREVDRVDEEGRQIWFQAGGVYPDQDPYLAHYCRVNLDGSGFTILTQGNGTHAIAFSPTGRFFVDTWSRVDLPPVTELRRAADGGLVCELERADASALEATGWRAPEPFVARGRDGETDIHGLIVRPTQFDPTRRYPVVEQIYAGPQSAHVPKAFRAFYEMQALAELGFILVQIDGMGTSHRSKAFHEVCWRNLGDAGFPDRIAWLKAAATRYPFMDLERVGVYGGSAGGQNAVRALIAHGDFYRVAVADCGCHDNRMDKIWWNELWMGWPIGAHYEEQSNVTQAHRLRGKLLLIVGEMDENVDPASTMQLVNALIKADKDFELLVMPGRGHGAAESEYGKRRRAEFLARHLGAER